jgi:DNA repair protein RadC
MQVKTYTLHMVKDGSLKYEGAGKSVQSSQEVFDIFREYFKSLDREHMAVIALDTNGGVIGLNTVAIGDLNSTIVHPREVYKFAILANANSIILAHNHPSGNLQPSEEDCKLTQRFADAGSLLGIELLDSLVIADDSYTRITFFNLEGIRRGASLTY